MKKPFRLFLIVLFFLASQSAPAGEEDFGKKALATIHKIAMTVAAAGMATQIVLGIVTASKEGQSSQRDFALAHQIVGYTTLAASLTGFSVLTF